MPLATRFAFVSLALAAPAFAQRPDLPLGQPEARYQFETETSLMVPMRDGVRLATDLYKPIGTSGRLPVILMRTPYNKATYGGAIAPARFFAGQGYQVVVQDTRGQFASEGEYRVQLTDDTDGYDTIDWIVKQPWSNGKVGTYGCSYLGEVQYIVSKTRHPNHVAMIPQSASGAVGSAGGYYTNFGTYDGGALTLSTLFGWFGLAGMKDRAATEYQVGSRRYPFDFAEMLKTLPVVTMARRANYPRSDYEDFVSHPPADPYWAEVPWLTDQDRFDTPAIHVNSWLDVTPEQTLYTFNLMRRNGVSQRARDHQYVIMSPTTHCASEQATAHTMVGQRDVGDARYPYWNIYLNWFDHWLKGIDNRITAMPKVHYYVMGKNEWRQADRWPVPEMRETAYYLRSGPRGAATSAGDGALGTSDPTTEGRDTFVYDPADPFPSRGGTICCTGNPSDLPGIFDQTDLETRRDLLVYSTPPLARGVTIAGTVTLVLYVSSDARDTDFTAKLIDVDPQGRSWNVLNGIKRARYRDGYTTAVFMEQDQVYRVEVGLKATGHHFAAGHRIRLWVSSSDFPGYDRNLNTGGNNYDESAWVRATNSVHHGGQHASRLILPVVPE